MVERMIVLAPAWPSRDSGYGLAIHSSLRAYREIAQEVYFFGVTPEREFVSWVQDGRVGVGEEQGPGSVHVEHIYIPRKAPALRFLMSLLKSVPSVSEEFQSPSVRRCLRSLFREVLDSRLKSLPIVFEDIPIATLIPWVKEQIRNARCVVRSHNVLSEAFEDVASSKGPILGPVWTFEVGRMRRFEREILDVADTVWAISEHDAEQYRERYSHDVSEAIGLCFRQNEVLSASSGSPSNIIHVGTADLRKGHGISWFVDQVWPKVNSRCKDAELYLAGRNTERFDGVAPGVSGSGFVEDDTAFMGRGQIFINPQHHGSGIQVKSIVAMLAERTLVSTSTGVEGIGGTPGEHFVVADSSEQMASKILSLIRNPERARRIAASGRAYAKKKFNCEQLVQAVRRSLDRT